MFCPKCGAEYRPGFDHCTDCDTDLVRDPPPEEDHEATPWVRVFSTSEVDVIPVIKSLLQSAGIPFETDGEAMMNLFPSDLLGPVLSRPRGEVRFNIPRNREKEASELLASHLEAIDAAEADSEETGGRVRELKR